MSSLDKHRKEIVRAIIAGCREVQDLGNKRHAMAFHDDTAGDHEGHRQADTCMATGLFFVDHMSEMQTTMSDYGPIWMGLWLDCELFLDDEGDGNTMFPRWLAEVLNEECDMGIQEDDIYDE